MENFETPGGAGAEEALAGTALLAAGALRSDDEHGLVHKAKATVIPLVSLATFYWGVVKPLLPVLDIVSDLNAGVQILMNGYVYSLTAITFILVLSWRFLLIYSALTPKPTVGKVAALYFPGALLPQWDFIHKSDDGDGKDQKEDEKAPAPAEAVTETEAGKGDVEVGGPALQDEAKQSPSPQGSIAEAPTRCLDFSACDNAVCRQVFNTTFPEKEVQDIRAWLQGEHTVFAKLPPGPRLEKLRQIVRLEAQLCLKALPTGPFLVWRSSITVVAEKL